MEKCKITNTERDKLLIKNVNDRPNSMATYGKSKLDPTQTKDLFDKQFMLMTERHNQLCEKTIQMSEEVTAKVEKVEKAEAQMSDKLSEFEEVYGDIETALDSIIAIQEALIGGDSE